MDENVIKQLYDAYNSGDMTEKEAAEFEADIKAGKFGDLSKKPTVPMVDEGIVDAYGSGKMTPQEEAEFEADLKAGKWAVPDDVSMWDKTKDLFTGSLRETPQSESLPDWGAMPEMNSFSMASFKSAAGTMMTGPEETIKVITSNFPGVQVQQDEKGNYIMTSSIDGGQYVIKPGFQPSDIPRVAGGMAAFTPAGGAKTIGGQILGAAATQGGIEATQMASGGDFDPEQIPIAGAMQGGGFLLGKGISTGLDKVKRVLGLGKVPTSGGAAASTTRIKPAILPPDELADTARRAAEGGLGSKSAQNTLASQASPDPKTTAAAERLGISEYLQPDHVTTNQVYRELAQAVKSVPGSEARAAEISGMQEIAKKADTLIDELGGLQDLSQLDSNVKGRMQGMQQELDNKTTELYGRLREAINPKTPSSADNLIFFIENRADELGGIDNLSDTEKRLLKQLSPKEPTIALPPLPPPPTSFKKPDPEGILVDLSHLTSGGTAKPNVLNYTAPHQDLGSGPRSGEAIDAILSGADKKWSFLDADGKGAGAVSFEVDELSGTINLDHIGAKEGFGSKIIGQILESYPNYKIRLESYAPAKGFWEKLGFRETAKNTYELTPPAMYPKSGPVLPTYALIDEVRKGMTAARIKKEGPFKDADSGLLKRLEKELLKDQKAAAEKAGQLGVFEEARQTVAIRKGIENDLVSLFGKELDRSMVGNLMTSTKKLPSGDVSNFIKLIKSVPEDMRQEVVASGLNTAFGKSARSGDLNFSTYSNWYEGLLRNKKAHAALMTNLPPEARKSMSDLYRVSNGIRMASRERITTGRINSVRDELRGADTLIGNIYSAAKRSAVGLAAETVTTPLGAPGAGIAAGIASALTKGKTDTMKAADKLISSPEFIKATSEGTQEAYERLSKTPIWKKFFNEVGSPSEMSDPAKWLIGATQTTNQLSEDK